VTTGIVIFAHGSPIESANQAVRDVAGGAGFELFETAFLDPVRPGLPEAVERLVERGASRILVIPYFLTLGLHMQRDLPVIVSDLSRVYKGMEIRITPPLDGHPALRDILRDRAREDGK
jgi:sirohydrochlorin ferrochelatase